MTPVNARTSCTNLIDGMWNMQARGNTFGEKLQQNMLRKVRAGYKDVSLTCHLNSWKQSQP